VSDANVVLGYLPPKLLGGSMALAVDDARRAVADMGARIGLSAEEAAQGILDIANEVMLGALRIITVQRGLDPRDFGIVAFGGAGPLHANAMAEVLGCYPVIVPPNPGVLSALGFVESEFKNEFVQTMIRKTTEGEEAVWDTLQSLHGKAEGWLAQEEVAAADRSISFNIDMRYEQQGFEVTVAVSPEEVAARDLTPVVQRFHDQHQQLYGVTFDVPIELVALRAVAIGKTPPAVEKAPEGGVVEDLSAALIETRPSYFNGAWHDTPNYDRDRLGKGARIDGPAIIVQYDTTTVLLPEHWAEVDEFGNLAIWPADRAAAEGGEG
jgi:N-methylhydantoinase A